MEIGKGIFESRTKVDLTKYIEEHHFTFDRVFNSDVSTQEVAFS